MIDPDTATETLQLWCDRRGVRRGTNEFLQYLADKDGLYLASAICRRLRDQAAEKVRKQTMHVSSGLPLTESQQKKLADVVDTENTQATVNETLMAGVRLSFGNHRVHGSLKDRLTNLHNKLRD
jgi:F0F1-type ATP synthase delta subunit